MGALLTCSGCGKTAAADAQTPPPQTLSEPVRPVESTPAQAPAIPVTATGDDLAAQKNGESRELPVFIEPARSPAPMAAAVPAPAADAKAGAGRYHVLAKGETLYGLSRKYNVNVKQIVAANQFKDPNKLPVGTKVYIPN